MIHNTCFALFLLGTPMLSLACSDSGSSSECAVDSASGTGSGFGDAELDGLLEATARFGVTATAIEADVRAACSNIATDLGGQASDDTAMACANAVAEMDRIFEANASATVTLEYTEPVCAASVDAVAQCAAECDVNFDATATPPTCTGGELSGSCSGTCQGECTVEGQASCEGECSGTCSGSCDATIVGSCTGTCAGQCEGTCSAMDGDGNCNGTCEGTCRGTCSGTFEGSCSGSCTGSCSASCRAELDGSCSGTCSGMCDVAFQAPTCEGGELQVDASADCEASCEADASFRLECSEPKVVLSYSGTASTSDDLDSLAATLEANYGTFLSVALKLDNMVSATADIAGRLGGATSAAASLGVSASSCLAKAVEAQVSAAASVTVSVQASASVTGSASAGTN